MTTLTDPCANIILDFIAGGVPDNPGGESGGNYNAVIGNANASLDLSQYTLAQIYRSVMAPLLARGEPSTAVGRYQIIRRTLEGLQEIMHLGDDLKFDHAMQDNLALHLLIGRGYNFWRAGTIDDQTFAHNLSCEWASLPDPHNGGKSHYDGIGPNHAGVSLAHVYSMLTRAKGAVSG